jgi:hypothetical protein
LNIAMIASTDQAEELWAAATASYLEWSGTNWPEAEWVRRAKSTLSLYKEYLKFSAGRPVEIKCRAQIGRVLFEGATHLGEIKRIAQEGLDKLLNASRAVAELEKALLLDEQQGGGFFRDPEHRELYLPILEKLWKLHADYLKNARGANEASSYLKNKMARFANINEEAQVDISLVQTEPAKKNGRAGARQTSAEMEQAPHAAVTFPAQTLIEKLFNTAFPDWQALLQAAENAKRQKPPFATAAWAEREAMHSSRALLPGGMHDIWAMAEGLCLYRHQHVGCLAKLLALPLALLAKLLSPFIRLKRAITARISRLIAGIVGPFYSLKVALETLLLSLARRLGHWFALLGIPLAIWGFMVDVVFMLVAFLRSMLPLLANPFLLLKEILLLPFRLLAAFLSRLIKTLLLAWIAKLLDAAKQKFLEMMLQRHPWLRGILLGFFRRERPDYPVLIPKRSVSQVLLMRRRGLFGAQEFLVIVEGDTLQIGFKTWLAYAIKKLVFPFYWERTIHMLRLDKKEREKIIQNVCSALDKPVTPSL